jgi:hypothetical protein
VLVRGTLSDYVRCDSYRFKWGLFPGLEGDIGQEKRESWSRLIRVRARFKLDGNKLAQTEIGLGYVYFLLVRCPFVFSDGEGKGRLACNVAQRIAKADTVSV